MYLTESYKLVKANSFCESAKLFFFLHCDKLHTDKFLVNTEVTYSLNLSHHSGYYRHHLL